MSTTARACAPYKRETAAEYALDHWNDPNPEFANFEARGGGGDCTNFTSQCLLAGGWPMDYRSTGQYTEWWYRRIGTDPFDQDGDDWWSCTWSIPETQHQYLQHNHATAYNLTERPTDVRRLQLGDLFYYDWNGDGLFNHSSILTGFDRFGRPLVTYRTLDPRPPVRNKPWRLFFRGPAALIVALHLTDCPAIRPQRPNWSALRPCDRSRATATRPFFSPEVGNTEAHQGADL